MGTVLRIDQATWSTMRMAQDARAWTKEHNTDAISRRGAVQHWDAVLKTFIEGVHKAGVAA